MTWLRQEAGGKLRSKNHWRCLGVASQVYDHRARHHRLGGGRGPLFRGAAYAAVKLDGGHSVRCDRTGIRPEG